MKYLKHVILGIIILSSVNFMAQEDTNDFKGRTSFLLHAGTPEFFGLYLNHYLNNRFSLNAGLGYTSNFHLGTNFYIIERNLSSSSLYAGAQFVSYDDSYEFGGGPDYERHLGVFIPVGYEYVGKKKFTFQIDIGPAFLEKKSSESKSVFIFFAFKFGITTKRK
jgi:hypothetical protein